MATEYDKLVGNAGDRKGFDRKAYVENWQRIFGKKKNTNIKQKDDNRKAKKIS